MSFRLIVGLGNPGPRYEKTRHNVGFMVLERLAAAESAIFKVEPKWEARVARLDDGTLLAQPATFMNLSGRSVRRILAFHKWPPSQLLVVFDDAALPLGALRFREKGSHGGHNGIRSIIEHMGTEEFPRLKLGIGASDSESMTNHVLGAFSQEEGPVLENMLATAVEAVQAARSNGLSAAGNRFNTRPTPPPRSDEP